MSVPLRLALLASLVALLGGVLPVSAQAAPDARPKIIGGTEASIEEAPWQVGLMYYGIENPRGANGCGGSVISAEWVVTAAHCVDFLTSPTELQVAAGVSTLPDSSSATVPRYGVERVLIHPEYNSDTLQADIALLKLRTALPIDGVTIAPIELPTFANWPAAGTPGLITGWGNSRSQADPLFAPALLKATVTVLAGPASRTCADHPEPPGEGGIEYYSAIMICAGTSTFPHSGICQGDSGGPLAIQRDGRWYLAGVTSWGRGCAEPGYPGVFARVTAFTDWIRAAQAPGATGALTVTASGYERLLCTFVYNATLDSGPVASRCGSAASSMTVPDVFPGEYLVKNIFEGIYDSDTWQSTSGPQIKRSAASTIKVTGGSTAQVSNASIPATAMSFGLPSSASTLGSDLCVNVYAVSQEIWTYNCLTSGSTSLRVVSIPPSAEGYAVYVSDAGATYASYYYTGAGQSGSLAYEQAQIVTSPVRATTSLSLSLTPAARISGKVTPSSGAETYARASLYVPGVAEAVATTWVETDGSYSFRGLPPGDYQLEGWDSEGIHLRQWWNGASTRDAATTVTVAAGGSTTGVDIALKPIERIEISVSRVGKGAKSQVVVKGTSTGLAGSRVTPWVKVAGAKRFVAATPVTVRADGTFTWTYRTPKAASVYVQAGSVQSATVQVRASS